MPAGRYPYFSRVGWIPFAICLAAGVFVVNTLGWVWSIPFWLGCAAIVYLFRDPRREIPASPLAVLSPADGVVTSIEEVSDRYLGRRAILMVINMSRTGVFSTRSPVEGKVLEPRNSGDGENRPHGVWLQTDEGDNLVMVMHRGPLRNVPHCYVRVGERVGQGQRCGHVPMGGVVEVYLPPNSRVLVTPGSQLKAGSDVIATLVHK
ncbi:MAG: phosphatidylserine decarboxylase [Gammaproteobacteria bacterium]|jgi:phosphatidylserine decarboxylase